MITTAVRSPIVGNEGFSKRLISFSNLVRYCYHAVSHRATYNRAVVEWGLLFEA